MIAQMSADTLMDAVYFGFRLAHAKTQQERNKLEADFIGMFEVYAHTDGDILVMHDFFGKLEENEEDAE